MSGDPRPDPLSRISALLEEMRQRHDSLPENGRHGCCCRACVLAESIEAIIEEPVTTDET